MAWRKYINPVNYFRKFILLLAKPLLLIGIPLRRTSVIGGETLVFVTTSYIEFFLRSREDFVRHRLAVNWIFNWVKPHEVFYDIGANAGGFSLLVGKRCKQGSGCVVAFEPVGTNFFSLLRNISENKLYEKVMAWPLAISDNAVPKFGSLYCSSLVSGSSAHSIQKTENCEFQQGVAVVSLDKFIEQSGSRFPNHIKIDVDGVEEAIIAGMRETLSDSRLKSLVIEVDGLKAQERIAAKLSKNGFREVDRDAKPREGLHDILFIRESLLSAVR